jgi:Rap1a immunity proteins
MIKFAAFVVLALAVTLPDSRAGQLPDPPKHDSSANYLLTVCKDALSTTADQAESGYCFGYVTAAWESTGMLNAVSDVTGVNRKYCSPGGVTMGQAVRVVVRHLETHPESLHRGAYSQVLDAFQAAFPCADRKRK